MSVEIKAQNDTALTSIKAIFDAVETANDEAGKAQRAAEAAQASADKAEADAGKALENAQASTTYANSALGQLGELEKVFDTLNWIAKHGQYALTNDLTVENGKWYFSLVGNAVSNPTGNPHALGYYEKDSNDVYSLTDDTAVVSGKTYYTVTASPESLAEDVDPHDEGYYELTSVDEAISNYVSTHLSLTPNGLYVQIDDSACKLQISSNAITLYDANGVKIASYSDIIRLGNPDNVHITLSPVNGLGFYEGTESSSDASVNRVAYIDSQKLYISQSEITTNLRIGKFLWKVQSANRISLIYSPIN